MSAFVVVLDALEIADPEAAARALAASLGGAVVDHAQALAHSFGLVGAAMPRERAEATVRALRSVGCGARTAPAGLAPGVPRPLTTRLLDPRAADALTAQIGLTGPPERMPWSRILLVVPAMMQRKAKVAAKKQSGPSFAHKVVGVATGAAVLSSIRKLGTSKTAERSAWRVDADPMIAIVAANPLRRVHAFAERLDYSVLGSKMVVGGENLRPLVAMIRERCRGDLAGAALLDGWLAGGPVPEPLWVEDGNTLARLGRWLLVRSALDRLAA